MINALLPKLLQPLTRSLTTRRFLHPYLWRYLIRVRNYFATAGGDCEFVTTIEKTIKVRTNLSDHIESQLFWQGFQEADEGVLRLIYKYLPRDGIFFDIGANIGSLTLVGAKIASAGQIYAFEPSDHHCARLTYNLALNNFSNVTLIKKGLHSTSGTATLYRPSTDEMINNSGAASLYPNTTISEKLFNEKIELIKLDDFVEEQHIFRIDLIKIDIEGSEYNALLGGLATLKRFRPVVLIELDQDNLYRAGCTSADILNFWYSLDYQVSRINVYGEITPVNSDADLGRHQNLFCQPQRKELHFQEKL